MPDDAPHPISVETWGQARKIEHAAMTLEWLRRRSPVIAKNLTTYVGTTGPVTELEAAEEDDAGHPGAAQPAPAGEARPDGSGSLGIGSLR